MKINYDLNEFARKNRNAFPKTFDMNTLTQEDLCKVFHAKFKSPAVAWWLLFFLGPLGAGRFYLGEWGKGLSQLVLCSIFVGYIWILVDLFTIRKHTRELNMSKLQMLVTGQSGKVPLNIHT